MIKVLKDQSSLQEFKSVWIELFEKDTEATPFQQFEYINASIEYLESNQDKLYIIIVKDDPTNLWIAVFPFVIDLKHRLRFINARHSDFCAPIIHPDYNNYNIYKELSDFIAADSNITGIMLENVVQDSQLLAVFKPSFRYMITHDMSFYSTIPIYRSDTDSDSVDAFRYVQAKQRKNLRKTKKKITGDYNFRIVNHLNADYPETEIMSLVKTMLESGIRVREYFSDTMLSFWKELYNNDVLSIAILSNGEKVLSCNFMFEDKKHNQYIKWIMLYTENSWNMAINIMIADYIYSNQGTATINFARGIYDYKLTNFHPNVKPLFCVKIAKTRWGHFKNILSTAFYYSKPIIKSFLGR